MEANDRDKPAKRCVFFHKYTKWMTYDVDVVSTRSRVECNITRQRRACTRCGYVQDELVC